MSVDQLSTSDDPPAGGAVELGATPSTQPNPTLFFSEIKSINFNLLQMKKLHHSLAKANESFKFLHQTFAIRYFHGQMKAQIGLALARAESTKLKLQSLQNPDAHYRGVHASNLATSVSKKLKTSCESFASLRVRISGDYREAVRRDHAAITGSVPEERMLNELMASGEAERFLKVVVQEQEGTMRALERVEAMGDRYAAARDIGTSLLELEHVLMDALALAEAVRTRVGDDVPVGEVSNSSLAAATPRDSPPNRVGCAIGVLLLVGIVSVVAIVLALT